MIDAAGHRGARIDEPHIPAQHTRDIGRSLEPSAKQSGKKRAGDVSDVSALTEMLGSAEHFSGARQVYVSTTFKKGSTALSFCAAFPDAGVVAT